MLSVGHQNLFARATGFAADTVLVEVRDLAMSEGDSLAFFMSLEGTYETPITDFELELSYDSTIIFLDTVFTSATTIEAILDGFDISFDTDTAGILKVSGTSESGTLDEGIFLFLGVRGTGPGSTVVSIEKLVLNEGEPFVNTGNGTVTVSPLPVDKADLAVNLKSFPDSTSQASTIQLFMGTTNWGNKDAPPYRITVYFSADDSLSDDDEIGYDRISTSGISSGQGRNLQLPVFVPRALDDGDYYLIAELDRESLIPETSEYPNVDISETTIFVGSEEESLPDLRPRYGSFSFNPNGENVTLSFEAIAQNNGEAAASEVAIRLYISEDSELSEDDPVFFENTFASIAANASDTADAFVTVPDGYSGDYKLYLVVDPDNTVAETDEGNNVNSIYGFSVSIEDPTDLPDTFTLSQNYPNPFNPTTNIAFELPQAESVDFRVFDMLGREVHSRLGQRYGAGSHIIEFNASALSSGIYFYRLQAGNQVLTRKMTLVK